MPRLVVLHGLEGSLDSHYARGISNRVASAGWGVDFILFRGCGTEPNHAPRFYHSGETSDLDFVIHRLGDEFPRAPLVLVGYSLGGNVLLKWLGERRGDLPPSVQAAAAVSVPYDLAAGARFISCGFSRIYERYFLRTLKLKAARKLREFPGLFDMQALDRADTIVAFDDAVTAPVHGFGSADDYYTKSSSIHFLPKIRLPTLLLSAFDDPFLPPEVLARVARVAAVNSALTTDFPSHGGHVGFVTGNIPGAPRYWSEERVTGFLTSHVARLGSAPGG